MRRLHVSTLSRMTILSIVVLLFTSALISFHALPALADPPTNDNLVDATVINPISLPFSESVDVTAATMTTESGEELGTNCSSDTLGSLWWSFTPTVTTIYQIDTTGSNTPPATDTVLMVYPAPDPLDFPQQTPATPCSDEDGGGGNALLNATLNAGTTYLIRVSEIDDGNFEDGSIQLNINYLPASNDNLSNASFIDPSQLPYSNGVSVTAANLTNESGEDAGTSCSSDTFGSLWWTFTPTFTAIYQFDSNGSAMEPIEDTDTALVVYLAPDPLAYPLITDEVTCNDEGGDNGNALATSSLTAGVTYLIRVGEINDGNFEDGNIVLNVRFAPPANDDLAGAIDIDPSALPFSEVTFIGGSTLETNEVVADCVPNSGSLWWSFTPDITGIYQIDTIGSASPANDTVLSIHTGTGHPLNQIACVDDEASNNNSLLDNQTLIAGTPYYIRVAIYDSIVHAGPVQLNVTFLNPIVIPANDNLANAVEITTLPFSDTVDTSNMTTEPNEVEGSLGDCFYPSVGSVWWEFTPTVSGIYEIDTIGSESPANDTILSIYTGTSGHPLDEVACDDQSGGNDTSFLDLTLTAGITYYIRIADYDDGGLDGGIVHLNVTAANTAPPPNDDLANAIVVPSVPFSDTVNTANMTTEPSETGVSMGDCDPGSTIGSVWWSFTPAANGNYQIDTLGSTGDASDTVLSVYTGSGHPLTEFACNDEGGIPGNSVLSNLALTGGITYYIRIADYDEGEGLDSGIVQLNVNDMSAPPINDDLANAIIVPPVSDVYQSSIETRNTTEETGLGEVDPDCAPTEGSVWWSFTPDTSGLYGIAAVGYPPADDTVLSIYTDSDPTIGGQYPVSQLACNDDASFDDGPSAFTQTLTAGTEYFIRVADFDDDTAASPDGLDTGFIQLLIVFIGSPPANDNFADAFVIAPTDLPYTFTEDISGATIEPSEEFATCGDDDFPESGSVWWSFTPDTTGAYDIDTFGSEYPADDTVLSIYTGASLDALTEIACNDDVDAGSEDFTSLIEQVELTAGTTYTIRVGIYECGCSGFPEGEITLNITPPDVDTYVSISAASSSIAEGSSTTITVSRVGDTSEEIFVALDVDLTGDSNTHTSDYTITGGGIDGQEGVVYITIPAGASSVQLTFTATDEIDAEPDNTLSITVLDDPDLIYFAGTPFRADLTIPRNDLGVTVLTDAGEGSLRQAIENATEFPGDEDISLTTIGAATIELGAPLTIDTNLTITGDTNQSVSGCGCSQVFVINSGTVLLRGFTITGGTAAKGGGVAVFGGNVTIGNDPMTITGNTSSTCGAGLYVGGGTVLVQAGSLIANNTSNVDGGGICVEGGTLTVNGSRINDNYASNNGGGIYESEAVGSASVTVENLSEVSRNTASAGGGIYQDTGALSVTGSLIQSNFAPDNSAIRFSGTNTRSVTNSCIVDNNGLTAVTYAGGSGVIATGNWWGAATGPYTFGTDTPAPNDTNTASSVGDSVTVSSNPADFDYSSYLSAAPHAGCMVCSGPSSNGDARYCELP